MSLRSCKLKQLDTTTSLLKWLKSKIPEKTNAGENVEEYELSFITSSHTTQYSPWVRQFDSSL